MRASSVMFASVLATSFIARSASAEGCPVTAVLEGDGALVDSLATTLGKRGVSTTASDNCPATRARIDRKGNGIAISLVDPAGRRSERTIADVDAAASVIESWARQDVNAAALLGWTIDPVSAPAEPVAPVDTLVARAPARESSSAPIMISALGEGGVDFGGAGWYGGTAAACVRTGPMCVGARGRGATTNDQRRDFDVLGTVDVIAPLSPRIAFVGGVGGGIGWYSAPYQQGDHMRRAQSDRLRLDAHVGLTFQLARHVALDLGIAVGFVPTASAITVVTSNPNTEQPGDGDGTPGEGGDNPGGDTPTPDTRDLPEPFGYAHAGIGLRIGAP